jgi:hypothetical protein
VEHQFTEVQMETNQHRKGEPLVSKSLVKRVEMKMSDGGLLEAARLLAMREPHLYEMIARWGLGAQLAIEIPQTELLAREHVFDCALFAGVMVAEIFRSLTLEKHCSEEEEVDRRIGVWLPTGHSQAWPPYRREKEATT